MQPRENMNPRAVLTKSAPTHSAHAASQSRLDQRIDDPGQRFGYGKRHMVHERLGSGARAALAAVDREKVGRVFRAAAIDRLAQLVDELPAADRGLDAHRLAGELADERDLVEQLVDVGDVAVAVRADRILVRRDAADPRDLLGDLDRRQHPALAGLRALRKLDLERLHLGTGGEILRLLSREISIAIASAVVGGADLHDDVAVALEMERREPALARVHPAAGERRTAGSEIAPKLIPLMFTTDLARNGSLQKPSPIASGGVGSRSSSSTG